MGKKDQQRQQQYQHQHHHHHHHQQQQQQQKDQRSNERVEAVLELLRKQAPLTVKQEKYCNNACVERFLRAKGDNVKKAAKHLRGCLSWRESIGTEHLIADEFSAELAEGVAYVAGHDEESRPVLDYTGLPKVAFTETVYSYAGIYTRGGHCNHAKKHRTVRYPLRCKSASAFMNLLLATLKIVAEYYPGRLCKAFVIDPPSLFSYLWKGVRPFVELSTVTMVVSSLDFEESLEFNDFASYPRASSLRFDPSSIKSTAKIGSCSSSRFSFTVSHHFDSLKPWYLTLTDTSACKVGPIKSSPLGPALISPLNARSFSFASPAARTPLASINGGYSSSTRPTKKTLFPSTPLPQPTSEPIKINHPRTPRPSFLHSPALFFKKDCPVTKADKSRESFLPFLKFYRMPYDEMIYRSKMRPPLGGLISIVSPHIKRHHVSVSQRF